ncbi:hypothetical protein GCM10009539_08020 [Cryptosporangium japonicum]|uniref:Uncharacterized protein n=1 Tax=Cryptosporangium japonicum TaxID=80872 RepID=A0ABN0TM54_9ACTN
MPSPNGGDGRRRDCPGSRALTTEKYRHARDLLLRHRTDYHRAVAEFTWPAFDGPFNWAIDWFDAFARGNDRTALWIVEEDGTENRYSFDEMVTRSDRLADLLAAAGATGCSSCSPTRSSSGSPCSRSPSSAP